MPPRIQLPATNSAKVIARQAHRPLSTDRAAEDEEDPTIGSTRLDEIRKLKQKYREWLRGPGNNFRKPLWNEMNYLTSYDQRTWVRKEQLGAMNVPFPLNPSFRSFSVLSEDFKEDIWKAVIINGRSVRSVSAETSVTMERVAAVVRLKEVEKQWIKEEKPLATYLTKALHTMLPITQLSRNQRVFHESIQDIESHPFSHRQTFLPVSESREFTRADAGKEFGLPPTEEVIPHPDLVKIHQERGNGMERIDVVGQQKERDRRDKARMEEERRKKLEAEKAAGQVVEVGRFKWRLKQAETGKVGYRYGVPHQDRKKGQVKIPRSVE